MIIWCVFSMMSVILLGVYFILVVIDERFILLIYPLRFWAN